MESHRAAMVHSNQTSDLPGCLSQTLESLQSLGPVAVRIADGHPDVLALAERFDGASQDAQRWGTELLRELGPPNKASPPSSPMRSEYDFSEARREPAAPPSLSWPAWTREHLGLPESDQHYLNAIFNGLSIDAPDVEGRIKVAVAPYLKIPEMPLPLPSLREALLLVRLAHLDAENAKLRAHLHGRPVLEDDTP